MWTTLGVRVATPGKPALSARGGPRADMAADREWVADRRHTGLQDGRHVKFRLVWQALLGAAVAVGISGVAAAAQSAPAVMTLGPSGVPVGHLAATQQMDLGWRFAYPDAA